MAITNIVNPDDIVAAYRPERVEFSCRSTNLLQIVRVLADVYVDGVFYRTIAKDPDLGTIVDFTFDVSAVVIDRFTKDITFSSVANSIEDSPNTSYSVFLRFYEVLEVAGVLTTTWAEDGAGTGGVDTGTVSVTSSTRQVYEDQGLDDYSNDGISSSYLTNKPTKTFELSLTDTVQLDFLTNETNVDASITYFDENGVVISSDTPSGVLTNNKGRVVLSGPSMPTNTRMVRINLVNNLLQPLVALLEITVFPTCQDYKLIYWENLLGGIDWHYFKARGTKSNVAESEEYRKPLVPGFTPEDRGLTNLRTESFGTRTYFSQAQSREDLSWLQEIGINKRQCYTIENGVVIPLTVTEHKELYEDNFKHPFSFQFTARLANNFYSQHG